LEVVKEQAEEVTVPGVYILTHHSKFF
jgi:hypothetical protein